MADYTDKLINKPEAFLRETFERRMSEHGFKSMERMEKFLWDLELFLQIQEKLKQRIVLKGGAAIQFYLPMEAQRTSIDIDMIFYGKKEEIEETLHFIANKFGSNEQMFVFKEYKPNKPKTALPLYTYFVDVPSVLTMKELRATEEEIAKQEVKVEFIIQNESIEYVKAKGNNIFAVNSEFEYQILPLNYLFADKLTTLGPNTIGIQDIRLDEQIKQFYDIWMLTQYHFPKLKINEIRENYIKRAKQECEVREKDFDIEVIMLDVRRQLYKLKDADSGEDILLKKTINDFNGLYLNAGVEFNPQVVACGASLLELMYEVIMEGSDWNIINEVMVIVGMLRLDNLSGIHRGQKMKELREMLVKEFGSYSVMKLDILKGKRPIRIFWSVVNKDNYYEIKKSIEKVLYKD